MTIFSLSMHCDILCVCQPLLSICHQNSVRQCTIPPHPLACVQRERTCLEQSVYHTIQLFDHCANWTGGVWIQFIKVMYTQIYCFCFQNAIITKAILTSFSKPTSLNCSKYSCVLHPYAYVGSPVSFFPSPSFFLSHGTQLHSTISSYYTILSSETMCAGKNSLLLIFLFPYKP